MKLCAHPSTFGCRNYVADTDEFCWQHDPQKRLERDAVSRKRNRSRKPQGLHPAPWWEQRWVAQWMAHGGGAEAFEAFASSLRRD